MSTSSSAWSSRQLPALRCRCGWVTSSADAMRTASAPCLQSQNREAKASVARAEDDEQWTGILLLSPLFLFTLSYHATDRHNRQASDTHRQAQHAQHSHSAPPTPTLLTPLYSPSPAHPLPACTRATAPFPLHIPSATRGTNSWPRAVDAYPKMRRAALTSGLGCLVHARAVGNTFFL